MTKTQEPQETQRVASPNPSDDFQGQPPTGGVPPSVKGTPGTTGGSATSAPAPAKKKPRKRRRP